jgi:hypothetical protein
MRYVTGKQVKIISGANAFDFETKLNSVLAGLNEQGIKYELQLAPQTGLVAYIVFEEEKVIPETKKDEFELGGEKHVCIECPYFVRPTDGRIKYTRCRHEEKMCWNGKDCCEWFYEELFAGRITLKEIWNGKGL